jgi:methyl-accepting chemotaxis protein-1 (serine sensor receptor)
MSGLTIKARLYVNLGILAVALLVVGAVGLRSFSRASDRMEALYGENLLPVGHIGEIFERSLLSQQYRLETYVHRDVEFTKQKSEAIKANRGRINELVESFDKLNLSTGERRLADEIKQQRAALVGIGKQEMAELLAGNYDAAAKIRIGSLEPIIDRMDPTTQKLAQLRLAAAEQLIVTARQQVTTDRRIMLVSLLFALAFSGWFAWLLARHISRGLAQAEDATQRVSRGELGRPFDITGNDEIARLLQALKAMDAKLVDTVSQVRDTAALVESAADQLSQGSDDLCERTQQQAAALEQTAASVEEMTSTVRQNADNANQTNKIAAITRGQADQGSDVVNRAAEAMHEITSSSKRIGAIISVIDEVAFQTNLLALNAAVEAARAGEQGRGFAVVASEVRNLAQRSAGAAKEIKQLIADAVAKVGAGTQLVAESGRTLNTIVTGVKKVTDIVAEMAAATEEQSKGIDQINTAITNMDSVTQQNAALVEESTAAAKSVKQQAQELRRLVAFFHLEGAPKVSATTAPVLAAVPSRRHQATSTPREVTAHAQITSHSNRPAKASGG